FLVWILVFVSGFASPLGGPGKGSEGGDPPDPAASAGPAILGRGSIAVAAVAVAPAVAAPVVGEVVAAPAVAVGLDFASVAFGGGPFGGPGVAGGGVDLDHDLAARAGDHHLRAGA